MTKYRADELLAAKGLAPSRSAARQLILEGRVSLGNGSCVRKPGQLLEESSSLSVSSGEIFVSRAAGKLLAALDYFKPEISCKIALDLGASTGGFTEVLLSRGAAKVYAVDVGTGQLHPKLREDPRVVSLEQTNARYLDSSIIPEPVEILTGDLCFISLTKVLPACKPLMADNFTALLLIKPQFEAERSDIGSGGIVRSEAVRQACIDKITNFATVELGWKHAGTIPSPVIGSDGNQEFLAAFTNGN